MKAVVLVGGFGTRLRPLTLTTPKQMLPLVDRPMIEYVIGALKGGGVGEVVLSLGYKDDAFRAAYPDAQCCGIPLSYAVEPEPLDTAGAIRFAADFAGIDETFVVVNGDVLTDLDLRQLWQRHHETKATATIALTQVDDPSRYGVVPTDAQGQVLGFVEKPLADTAPTNWINAGTYVLEAAVLDGIAKGHRVSIEREVFPQIAAAGGLWGVRSDAYWIDIGTPATYLQAQLDLISGVRGSAAPAISASAHIDPAALVERSVIMADAVVAAGAVVHDSIIMAGAKLAANARVEGSIVGTNAVVDHDARVVGMSLVGDGVLVGANQHLVGAKLPASH